MFYQSTESKNTGASNAKGHTFYYSTIAATLFPVPTQRKSGYMAFLKACIKTQKVYSNYKNVRSYCTKPIKRERGVFRFWRRGRDCPKHYFRYWYNFTAFGINEQGSYLILAWKSAYCGSLPTKAKSKLFFLFSGNGRPALLRSRAWYLAVA